MRIPPFTSFVFEGWFFELGFLFWPDVESTSLGDPEPVFVFL